jgi:hypothetical protein
VGSLSTRTLYEALPVAQQLETLLSAIKVLKDLPVTKLAENKRLVSEIKAVVNGKGLTRLINDMHRDYLAARNVASNAKDVPFGPESPEFLRTFARYKMAAHNVFTKGLGEDKTHYTHPLTLQGATAFNAPEAGTAYEEKRAEAAKLKEAKEFEEVFNSIFSDRSLQIGTAYDPTRIGSYIDYSPYIYNYQYYLSIPTLSQTIDKPIQIATRAPVDIQCEDDALDELLTKILKRTRFVEKLRRFLLFSHLSPRGALLVPILNKDDTIRFNIFNDTQFTYSTGYQYSRLDFRDDGSDGVTQVFCLGTLLRNGVTAHFLCPGFEPLFAIGKNRLFQLKDAAEAVNIYLYTVKVLCIRAQILVQQWDGEGQNDTMIQRLRALTEDIDSSLSLSTSVKIPAGAKMDILNNNFSEGFSKVSPIIKEYQGMLSGVSSDFFYGSDTAYSANSFNIHATHQNIRSEIQEGQIEPALRFVVNQYLKFDKRFAKWKDKTDEFDLEFASLYEPTDSEKADIEAKRIDNIIKMAGYPELSEIFKDEKVLGKDYVLPEPVAPPTNTEPPADETPDAVKPASGDITPPHD